MIDIILAVILTFLLVVISSCWRRLKKEGVFNICNNYEYDESGTGKMYGACCATCINSHTKKCPKESKKKGVKNGR